jgi:hypothetical protein
MISNCPFSALHCKWEFATSEQHHFRSPVGDAQPVLSHLLQTVVAAAACNIKVSVYPTDNFIGSTFVAQFEELKVRLGN